MALLQESLAAATRTGAAKPADFRQVITQLRVSSPARCKRARVRASRRLVLKAGPRHSPGEARSLAAWRTSCSPPGNLTSLRSENPGMSQPSRGLVSGSQASSASGPRP